MSKEKKIWAKKQRKLLMFLLGGACKKCGTTELLEFDCIESRGDAHHRYDTSHRMSFYRREYYAGNLQILCQVHNGEKGAAEKNGHDAE